VALSLLLGGAAALALEGRRLGGASLIVPIALVIALLFALFLRRESRHPDPVFDPRLFRNRGFAAAAGGVSFGNLALYTTLLATPLLFARTTGWSNGQIGLALAVLSAPTALLAPLGGTLADRLGRRFPATLGQTIVAASLVPLAIWPSSSPGVVLACLAVAGVGGGLTGAAQQASAVEAVSAEQAGVASGIFSTSRYIGGIAGSVVLAGLLNGRSGSGGFSALFAVTAAAGLLAAVAGLGLSGRRQLS
jgi:DHA2 family methylenomycin A resistance protein-like MFS transporter